VETSRRSIAGIAAYVDRLFKGADAADLPVEPANDIFSRDQDLEASGELRMP